MVGNLPSRSLLLGAAHSLHELPLRCLCHMYVGLSEASYQKACQQVNSNHHIDVGEVAYMKGLTHNHVHQGSWKNLIEEVPKIGMHAHSGSVEHLAFVSDEASKDILINIDLKGARVHNCNYYLEKTIKQHLPAFQILQLHFDLLKIF